MAQLTNWRGRCPCGETRFDATFDIGEQARSAIKSRMARVAAGTLAKVLSSDEPTVFMAECGKCGRRFQITITKVGGVEK